RCWRRIRGRAPPRPYSGRWNGRCANKQRWKHSAPSRWRSIESRRRCRTMDEILLYRRANESWGTRNHVLVMPVVASASGVARALARGTGATWVEHDYEPTPQELPRNRERVARTFTGFATNPNVAAVLLVAATAERA